MEAERNMAGPAPAPTSTTDVVESNQSSTGIRDTQTRLQILQELHSRFQAVRSLPAQVLRLQSASTAVLQTGPVASTPRALALLQVIDEFSILLRKDEVQDALRSASQSESSERPTVLLDWGAGAGSGKRRITVKSETPSESPGHSANSCHLKYTPIFPHLENSRMTAEELPAYIRQHNRSNSAIKLHIWAPKHEENSALSRSLSNVNLVILRVAISDVGVIFIKLFRNADAALSVESVAAFGPREKAGPYGHSEYAVYQKLSQQIATMVELDPKASVPQLVDLMTSYKDLFIGRCELCERILSLEEHIPPVGRIWREKRLGKSEDGYWEARHLSCMQE